MITVDKDHISRLMLFEAYAEKHQAEEKIRLYHQKYSRSFDAFEDHIQNAAEENFENFDDYIEWKAYRKIADEINSRIAELKLANIKVA